jgi:hypothetical protein
MNTSRSRGRKRVWRVVINKLLTNRHRTDTLILKSPARYHPVDIPKAPGHFLSDANDRLPTATKKKKRDETQTVKRCHREKQKGTPRLHCHLRSKNPSRDILATRKLFGPSRWSAIFIQLLSFSLCVCVTANELWRRSRWERERENPPAERSRDIGEAHRDKKREKKETSLWRAGVWMTHDDAASTV